MHERQQERIHVGDHPDPNCFNESRLDSKKCKSCQRCQDGKTLGKQETSPNRKGYPAPAHLPQRKVFRKPCKIYSRARPAKRAKTLLSPLNPLKKHLSQGDRRAYHLLSTGESVKRYRCSSSTRPISVPTLTKNPRHGRRTRSSPWRMS